MIHIVSFGAGGFSPQIRLLGSTKKTTSKSGTPPKLTKAGVDAWAREVGRNVEVRTTLNLEHRRFILLSSRRVIIVGISINDVHKNEAVFTESDDLDRNFFDSE